MIDNHSNKPLHFVIIAGEASGDQHAAHLVQGLKKLHPHSQFSGMTGKKMQAEGVETIADLSQMNVMGFTEIIKKLGTIYKIFKRLEKHLQDTKPDVLILVDSPDFNLRLAKKAKAMGIKVVYYISPQLWAWKAGRMKTVQENIDLMAVILPFEKKLYDDAGVLSYFVGHPLIETVKTHLLPEEVCQKWNLPSGKRLIGLLPGSRMGEIKRMLPIMLKAAEKLNQDNTNLAFVLPMAPTLDTKDLEIYLKNTSLNIHITHGDNYDVINACHSLMATSGTATLETALLLKPMIIVYKTSFINYVIVKTLVHIKYIGLCNILAGKMVVPEMIQKDLTPDNLCQAMQRFLDDPDYYNHVIDGLKKIRSIMTSGVANESLAELTLKIASLNKGKQIL